MNPSALGRFCQEVGDCFQGVKQRASEGLGGEGSVERATGKGGKNGGRTNDEQRIVSPSSHHCLLKRLQILPFTIRHVLRTQRPITEVKVPRSILLPSLQR